MDAYYLEFKYVIIRKLPPFPQTLTIYTKKGTHGSSRDFLVVLLSVLFQPALCYELLLGYLGTAGHSPSVNTVCVVVPGSDESRVESRGKSCGESRGS